MNGFNIVCAACFAPFEAILKNAGVDVSWSGENDTYGYNVVTEEWCDMLEAGVIDPTKVTRTALEKAVSVASTLLTTECMIVNEVEDSESEA
jgi:chaperonin GroEL